MARGAAVDTGLDNRWKKPHACSSIAGDTPLLCWRSAPVSFSQRNVLHIALIHACEHRMQVLLVEGTVQLRCRHGLRMHSSTILSVSLLIVQHVDITLGHLEL